MRIGAGRFQGRELPRARDARPAGARLKKSLFSVLEPRLVGARVLDLFAGVGGLGLEALSRGAAEVVLLDRDPRAVQALEAWLREVGALGEGRPVRGDALRGPLPAGPFDLVFLDPPFEVWARPEAPDLVARAVAALAPAGVLVLKVPRAQEPPSDPRWREVRRRVVGSVAWVLLEAQRLPPRASGLSSSPQAPPPMEEGAG